MRHAARARTWAGIALVLGLAVVVALLAALAFTRASGPGAAVSSRPTPTFDAPSPAASRTPTPTPTATAEVAPAARDAERFLAVGAGDVFWRGTAGSCAAGIAPVLERSVDGGATWANVTPTYRGITQILSVDPFAESQADMVATLGAGAEDPCDIVAMRTFSDGEFWGDVDDVLAISSYPTAQDPALIVTPEGEISAPCAEPRGFRSWDGVRALVCDGAASRWDGAGWASVETNGQALAVAIADGAVYVAHTADDCEGVAVSAEGSGRLWCDAEADPSAPVALAVANGAMHLWSGETLAAMELTEG